MLLMIDDSRMGGLLSGLGVGLGRRSIRVWDFLWSHLMKEQMPRSWNLAALFPLRNAPLSESSQPKNSGSATHLLNDLFGIHNTEYRFF